MDLRGVSAYNLRAIHNVQLVVHVTQIGVSRGNLRAIHNAIDQEQLNLAM